MATGKKMQFIHKNKYLSYNFTVKSRFIITAVDFKFIFTS